ncbi:hypothetical protein KOW79_008142 [Hemibagrus wyckioides]|uniref:Uncharacterized protein n=1 Tax=Hemibagrus wyckioides TaxID=337641 RepID=A0A9D3NVQ8_9TELE|nr:required for drug-induced death protein 1 isoform X1 [Hemibagrus wyckioides]KAG7328198.1 hypothetical protein KOW79_008142 [Hemibagrus wyckioides]
MPRRKLRKSKQKWKNREEDKAKIIIISVEEESVRATCEEACVCERETQKQKSSGRKQKTSKQVHFTVLPDRYEPLEEDRASDTAIDENKDNQEKYKRFRKNFGKALRYTWKCLVVGLQSFSTSYSGPLSAASTLVPDIQRTKPKA